MWAFLIVQLQLFLSESNKQLCMCVRACVEGVVKHPAAGGRGGATVPERRG
jgi:hypothetical protein